MSDTAARPLDALRQMCTKEDALDVEWGFVCESCGAVTMVKECPNHCEDPSLLRRVSDLRSLLENAGFKVCTKAELRQTTSALEQQNKEAEEYAGRMEAALENIRIVCRMARHVEEPSDLETREALDVIDHIARVRDHRGGTAKERALQGRVEATEAELRETAGELEKARQFVARCLPGSPNPVTWAEATDLAASATEELPCPGCGRPMARVGGPGARRGWTCVNCNAAGDPEEDH